jgi:hypothetical protein
MIGPAQAEARFARGHKIPINIAFDITRGEAEGNKSVTICHAITA